MKTSTDLVRTWGIIAALSFSSFGCSASSAAGSETPASSTPEPDKSPSVEASADKAEPEPKGPALLYTLAEGLAAPEAVIYDAEADVYFVSNVNGDPLAEDGNGFISKVGPDGKVQELKWIDGQTKGSTLNAPKGMALSKGFLYVADITWIRIFDRKTGEPKGKIFAKGATFLNGVTASEEGEIAFSDTGLKSGKDGFVGSGSDAVYWVDPKTVAAKEVARGKELGNPNGLVSTKDGLWVVNEQGELFLVGKDGRKEQTTKLAKGGLDGVVALDDGRFLVSSWKANAIYVGKPGGEFEVLLSDLKSPASIGFDTKRGRILLPKMLENQVLIYNLSGKAPATPSENPAAATPAGSPTAASPPAASTTPAATSPSPAKGEGAAASDPAKKAQEKSATPNPTAGKAQPSKSEPSKTTPSKAEPSKAEPSKAPQSTPAPSKPESTKPVASAKPAQPSKAPPTAESSKAPPTTEPSKAPPSKSEEPAFPAKPAAAAPAK